VKTSRRLQGFPPQLFWICWEKIVGDYFHSIRLDDMNYSAMREVYSLVRHRQGKSIDRFIDRYNETYFRELVWKVEDRTWQMMMDPDVLCKLTQPFHLQGLALLRPIKCCPVPFNKFWTAGIKT